MIAIIPARKGSKGLPGKNIKKLNGKPLISFTIEAAINAKSISKVIISTDCSKIAKISEKYKAQVPFLRPKRLAGDKSMAIDAYKYTIKKFEKETKQIIKNIAILLPTSPLRTSRDIDQASELFYKNNADSVISFTQTSHPTSWNRRIDANSKINFKQEKKLYNRQDEIKEFYPNGAIYIFKKDFLLSSNSYYSKNSYAYVMPRLRSIDIDTIDDFLFVEYLMEKNE